jgi:hypothetical protein
VNLMTIRTTIDRAAWNFIVGDRIAMHPATDLYMRGARFGTIEKIGRKLVTVKLDRLAKPVRVAPANILHVAE